MGHSRALKFEFNETMFDMMSSKTYTDPIRAVIRELACNALDAHVVAGNPKPFEIHLPTTHEPWFEIKDNGTGMNDEEIDALFALYGGSSKREDNQTIGALGIGSKSPYAYTKLYTVVSTKNGVTYAYTFHTTNGKPTMSEPIVTETPDAPNGVTVNFAVKEGDIWEFENKAKTALEFINPLPTVNVKTFVPHAQSYILKNKAWGLRSVARTAHHGYTCRAVMGSVQYAVGTIDESRTTPLQKKILEMPIDMFFELGELDFASSRESLQLTPKTIAAILKAVDNIVADTIEQVRAKIDACETLWQAQVLLFSIVNQTSGSAIGGSSMGKLIDQAIKDGKLYGQYKNFNFVDTVVSFNALDYNHAAVTQFKHREARRRRMTSKRAEKNIIAHLTESQIRELRQRSKVDASIVTANTHSIEVKPNVVFMINDTDKPADKYVNYFIQESRESSKYPVVYVIHRNQTDTATVDMNKSAKKLLAQLGNPQVLLVSALAVEYAPIFAARRPAYVSRKSHQIAVLKEDIGDKRSALSKGWMKAWDVPTEDDMLEDRKFYVVIEKMADANFNTAWQLRQFVTQVQASGKFGLTRSTPVFGIRKGHKLLKENDGTWVELRQHVFNRVAAIMTPTKTLSMSLYFKPFNDNAEDLLRYVASKKPLTQTSPIQSFALALDEAKGVKMDNWGSFKWVLDYCEEAGKYTQGLVMDFNAQWQKVKKLYPMLALVQDYSIRNGQHRDTLVEYLIGADMKIAADATAKTQAAASNS